VRAEALNARLSFRNSGLILYLSARATVMVDRLPLGLGMAILLYVSGDCVLEADRRERLSDREVTARMRRARRSGQIPPWRWNCALRGRSTPP